MTSFVRPVGVHRDIRELEFISAILQSHQHVVRSAGTIKAVDIIYYLKSRHGVTVPEDIIERYILTDLAGQLQDENAKPTSEKDVKASKSNGRNENEFDDVMDICQLTAILLIPELLKESEGKDLKCFEPFRIAVEAAMKGESGFTAQALHELFANVGEFNVSDEVIQSMIQIANRPEHLIDALINDVVLYNHHQDISNSGNLLASITTSKSQNREVSVGANPPSDISKIHTAPSIDFSSDTYRRPLFGMQLWTAGIAAYFAYVLNTEGDWVQTKCDSDTTACNIATGITTWLSIFFQIVCLGLPYIFLGSLGNADFGYGKYLRIPAILISMATVFTVTIFTFFWSSETSAFDTSGNKDTTGIEVCNTDDTDCIEFCTQNPDSPDCTAKYEVADDYYGASFYLGLILGFSILLSQFVDMVLTVMPQRWLEGNGLIQRFVLPGTVRQERAGKQAASYRMSQILQNALGVIYDRSTIMLKSSSKSMSSNDTENRVSTTLERFLLLPIKTETVGGVMWAWKKIWKGSIFVEEGVWFNGRLLACNFSQVTVFGILIFLTRVFYHQQKEFFYSQEEKDYQSYVSSAQELLYGNYTDVLGDDYYSFISCSEEALGVDLAAEGGSIINYYEPWNFISYMTTYFSSYTEAKEVLSSCFEAFPSVATFFDDSYNALTYETNSFKDLVADFDITPEKYIAAAWCGLAGGFLAVFYIAAILIPSFISTVLMFRSGIIPSLNDPEFLRYRYAMDTVTVLLGSAFWGCFFTAVGAMLFVIGLIFFIGFLPLIIGAVLGFVIILAIRLSVLLVLRCAFFSAFFRKKPGAANVMFTILEVWNIALTLGFVFIRAVKLIVISILYIARIDTPYLATGVGRFGPIELDSVSISFKKDILIHEAHRHMLIERYGLLCLIKLYSGDVFATRAGSAWRLLFVLITMPWLRKYRVGRNTIDFDEKIAQINDDIDEANDIWERDEKMLEIKALKSEQALLKAGNDVTKEINALRQRNAYLEEMVKSLSNKTESAIDPNLRIEL